MDSADYLFISGLFVVFLFLHKFLPSYISEKGKNQATKEDIKHITDEIEAVKQRYAADHERLKDLLDRGKYANQRRYDLEIEVYKVLWDRIDSFLSATAELRPLLDTVLGEGETPESRYQQRVKKFAEVSDPLEEIVHKNRPFYSPEVWEKVRQLIRAGVDEAWDYRGSLQSNRADPNYWTKLDAEIKRRRDLGDEICEAIRKRIAGME